MCRVCLDGDVPTEFGGHRIPHVLGVEMDGL